MRIQVPKLRPTTWALVGLLIAGGAFAATSPVWLPWARPMVSNWLARQSAPSTPQPDEHAGHDHGHAGHSEDSSIELSANALRNVGFEPITIEPTTYVKTITVPAMVVERPGRSQIHITAPLTGVVAKIVPIQGAAIEPDSSMFEIRLTHEELVTAQSNLVRTAESLDIVNREIARLQAIGEGVIVGKRILEQEYEKQKLEASLRAERQALLLHGLSENDVESILRDRMLFQSITVNAPTHGHDGDACREDHLFHVQELPVKLGQQVEAGQVLCVLADHCELYIEGRAFELRASEVGFRGHPRTV